MPKSFARTLVRLLLALSLALPSFAAPQAAHAVGYDRRVIVINTAQAQLGKPYQWGAEGPNSFDCSGLVYYCYHAAGTTLSRMTAADYYFRSDRTSLGNLEPGDLCFRTNLPDHSQVPTNTSQISHVGIYVGAGLVIHAPGSGKPVTYTSASNFYFFGRLKASYWPPQQDRTYDQPPVLTADFDGDRKADLAYVYRASGTTTTADVALSQGSTFKAPARWFTSPGRWEWDRTKVVAGDFNGDGKGDIAALYDYGKDTSKLWVWLSTGRGFRAQQWWASGAGALAWQRTKIVAGDFDGDKRCDVGIFYDEGGASSELLVARSTGSSFETPREWWSSDAWDGRLTKVTAGDLTGDGKADAGLLYDYGKGRVKLWVLKSFGTKFALQYAPWFQQSAGEVWDWPRTKMVTGDFNGDRRADVMMLYDLGSNTSKFWELPSTGAGFKPRIAYWASRQGAWDWERSKIAPGDFDADGRTDTEVLYDYGPGKSKSWIFDAKMGGLYGGLTTAWTGPLEWNRLR